MLTGRHFFSCLAGKPGEFRRPSKGNITKMKREYEYMRIRLGFLPKRVGPTGTCEVKAVAILYRFDRSVCLEMAETWADLEFQAGSFCMKFGEVVEWVGLRRWVRSASGEAAGVTDAMVDDFISRCH